MSSSPAATEAAALGEAERALLRRRARRVAARPEVRAETTRELVLFDRAGTRFAVALGELREIRPFRNFCPLPEAAPTAPGVLYYRGEILSIHDLAPLVQTAGAPGRPAWVLVVEHGEERLGLLADALQSVEPVGESELRPAPLSLGGIAPCVAGVVREEVLLLRAGALFRVDTFYRGL